MLIDDFQVYFKHGGKFYQILALSSGCIELCMKYQLSNLIADDFVNLYSCHEHTRRYTMIKKWGVFFSDIISDAYKKVSEASIFAEAEHSGGDVRGKVLHIRTGIVTIVNESTNFFTIFLGRIINFHMRK